MQNELESVIEKVQKLLRLAESQNEYEAQSATTKARSLMRKHKLSMNDIQEKEDKVVQGETEKMNNTDRRVRDISILSQKIGLKSYFSTYKMSGHRFDIYSGLLSF